MSKEIDMTDMTFGRLKVIEKAGETMYGGRKVRLWRCACKCGQEVFVCRQELRDKKSCGCLKKDLLRERNYKHGESVDGPSRLYQVYHNMKARCYNSNSNEYDNYGGRGIRVCNEWLNSPEAFFAWAKANGYCDDLTIDRIDVNGSYEPENCRFVTMKEQANNVTRNHLITYNGKTMTMSEWAEESGIPYYTLRSRINNLGWEPERALTQPVRHMRDWRAKHNGLL